MMRWHVWNKHQIEKEREKQLKRKHKNVICIAVAKSLIIRKGMTELKVKSLASVTLITIEMTGTCVLTMRLSNWFQHLSDEGSWIRLQADRNGTQDYIAHMMNWFNSYLTTDERDVSKIISLPLVTVINLFIQVNIIIKLKLDVIVD
jgi:hypothetical protein